MPETTSDETAIEQALSGGVLNTLSDPQAAFRSIAEKGAPQYQDLAVEGASNLRGLAGGSSASLVDTYSPQIRQLRDHLNATFSGVSKRLGPSGGRQIERGKTEALSGAGESLAQLFAGGQQQAVQRLLQFLQGIRPALLTQIPQTTSSSQPADYSGFGKALASAAGLAGQVWPQTPNYFHGAQGTVGSTPPPGVAIFGGDLL